MSITVRTYTQEELESIKSGKNRFLATVFMNGCTFSEHDIKYYPYDLRKTYLVYFKGQADEITVYATSDFQLKQFIVREYNYSEVEEIIEIKHKQRTVEV
jgi:hypothetical protein